ncbi:MAG: lipocalin family protein [Saprospiraceae bacterium]
MNRVLLFASIALVSLVFSCKKDAKPEELVIGKWKVTKLIADGDDLVAPNVDFQTQAEVEFTKSGTVVFTIKTTDFTVTPAEMEEFISPGTYSWEGDKIKISIDDFGDVLSITGNIDVSENRLIINATSGDIIDFFSLLEADKI